MGTRLAGNKEGKGNGCKGDGNGNEGGVRQRGQRASDGNVGDGNGEGNNRKQISCISNTLKHCGIRRGDVMRMYMLMVPELAMMMLACVSISAVHSVVFAGFSADAIANRVADVAAFRRRGGRSLPLKRIVDAAIGKEIWKCIVRKVLVFVGGGGAWEGLEGVHVRFTPLPSRGKKWQG